MNKTHKMHTIAKLHTKRFSMPLRAITLVVLIGFSIIACSYSRDDEDGIPLTYTLTFDSNGGTGTPPNSRNAEGGDFVTLPDNTSGMIKGNATFDGWNTNPDGTGIHYKIGSDFTMPNSNFTLYAQWNDSIAITVGPELPVVNKFEAEPYIGLDIKDKIKHSYSYENYDIYYIYLGKLRNIPLFFYDTQHHNGINSTYKISSTKTTTEKITETITNSSKTAINVIDTYTTSTTTGGKISAEIKADFKILWGLIKVEGPKAADEYYVNNYVYNSGTQESNHTTSLSNTITTGTEYTNTVTIERAWDFTKDDKVGYYRYTLFSTSDVYLYVVKDISTGVIDYEFREYVIPDSLNENAWVLDYSEDGIFRKTDDTGFKFDISMLYNLPETKLSFTAPLVPDNVYASAQSPSVIAISWDSESEENSYAIYRSTNENGKYSLIGTSTSTFFTDTGLAEATTYYYKIRAINDYGSSEFSDYDYATTMKIIPKRIEFTTSGKHTYTFNGNSRAIIQLFAIGGGGGGQGGHSWSETNTWKCGFLWLSICSETNNFYGTGGAGGGSAAAYMKLILEESTTFNIEIGKGGSGGSSRFNETWGVNGESGGETKVSWDTNSLIVKGGSGGSGSGQTGGSGGIASTKPIIIPNDTEYWRTATGNNGGNGSRTSNVQSVGGNAASITTTGYLTSFGGGSGAVRNGIAQAGGGGYGGYSSGQGGSGGDGGVLIVITEL